MQLTHFGHSCVLADFGQTTLLFDPGNFSHGFEGITGLSAIVITHQHPDHVDAARLPALLDANPGAALYADPQTTAALGAHASTPQDDPALYREFLEWKANRLKQQQRADAASRTAASIKRHAEHVDRRPVR